MPGIRVQREKARAAAGVKSEGGAVREKVRQHLSRLGLVEVEERLDEHLVWAAKEKPSYEQLVERILGEAAGRRHEYRVERRIETSGLKVRKTLEAFNWNFQPKLQRPAIEELASLRFIDSHEDLLFTGKSGTGKSHILQALVLKACQQARHVRYARCTDLLDDLYAGLADSTYERRMKRWCRPELLVIDDVGLGQIKKRDDEPTAAHALYTLVERRHMQCSTAVTSNIKLSAWGKYLGDAALAAAILDRLVMNSIRIDIDGPSYRQHLARQRAGTNAIELPERDE